MNYSSKPIPSSWNGSPVGQLSSDKWQPGSANAAVRLVGFFPGLGSRTAYRDAGSHLFSSQFGDVSDIYHQAAAALGSADRPENLLLRDENIPSNKLERSGFLGAAFLTHNLALEAHFRAVCAEYEIPMQFLAYAGESLGVLSSLVAAGAITCQDAIKIAYVFEPMVTLFTSGRSDNSLFASQLAAYFPEHTSYSDSTISREPSYVVALKGQPDDLSRTTTEISKFYSADDVEIHKRYSEKQQNFYVRAGIRREFLMFMTNFPSVETSVMKGPTEFLAHSRKLRDLRQAIAKFIEGKEISFSAPHTPVIPNHGGDIIKSGPQAKQAVLAIVDQVMESKATAKGVEAQNPNLVVEFGLGQKSIKLLNDNCPNILAVEYTGVPAESGPLIASLQSISHVTGELEVLKQHNGSLRRKHYNTISTYFKNANHSAVSSKLLHSNIINVINRETSHSQAENSAAYFQYLEIIQHTFRYRSFINIDRGELAINAREKRRIDGDRDSIGLIYTEIKIYSQDDKIRIIELDEPNHHELIVIHFDDKLGISLNSLHQCISSLLQTQPAAQKIWRDTLRDLRLDHNCLYRSDAQQGVLPANLIAIGHMAYKYILFKVLKICRPAIFTENLAFFTASGHMGWLLTLASTGSISLSEAIQFYVEYLRQDRYSAAWIATLTKFSSSLKRSSECIVARDGTTIQSKMDIEKATRNLFTKDLPLTQRRIQMPVGGNICLISIGSDLSELQNANALYGTRVISIRTPDDVWNNNANAHLALCDEYSISSRTRDNQLVLQYARSRKIPSSAIYSYLLADEKLVGFGVGGSESLTMFIAKETDHGR